eukprot:SAG22_NODE_472_length_10094_cov_6.762581_5_plen_55_part_00
MSRVGIGLCSTCKPQNTDPAVYNISERFETMRRLGVEEVDIWESPIPEDWFQYM